MTTTAATTITIRRATTSDASALERLAALDSANVPPGQLLVAAAGDEVLAAISIGSGTVIADPFAPTADLVALLRLRAERLRGPTDHWRLRGLRAALRVA